MLAFSSEALDIRKMHDISVSYKRILAVVLLVFARIRECLQCCELLLLSRAKSRVETVLYGGVQASHGRGLSKHGSAV